MSQSSNLTRRDFLKVSAVAGIGLLIEVYLTGCQPSTTQPPGLNPPLESPTPEIITSGPKPTRTPELVLSDSTSVYPSLYLKISKDGLVTVTVPRSEMGQGTRTALAMLVAEELCADWSTVRIEQAPGDAVYGDQNTGGSTSIQTFYNPLRTAGAIGRELMVRAAAETWNVDQAACSAENNTVFHQPSGKQLAYKDLVDKAGTMEAPSLMDIELKKPEEFTIIGTSIGRFDNPQIVTGKAIYGIDIRLPGMFFATVARPPVLGGKLVKYDALKAEKVPGVRQVVEIESGVAVVADNSWAAIQGKKALDLTWDEGLNANLSSDQIEQELLDKANALPVAEGEMVGVYTFPYFGHMTMEPMNCTANVQSDQCEVWVPTQSPQNLLYRIAMASGVPQKSIRVNVTLLGGGFGRRLEMSPNGNVPAETDYVTQAVQISKAIGAPVQVIWTREEDLHHDLFHPISVTRASAKLDDPKSLRLQKFESNTDVPAGYWRSVTNPPEAFARECFLDEYAFETGVDPLDLRRKILTEKDLAIVELTAQKAGWGQTLPVGVAQGFAFHSTWGVTGVAEVAEVALDGNGGFRVHRVVCAIDCGQVINPDMVIAQVESGVIFGLTAVLKEAIQIEKGRVKQSNFDDYPILRFNEMPKIEVYIVPSSRSPSGVGEMGNPPLAPAVANALFALTGKRIRRIPIHKEDL